MATLFFIMASVTFSLSAHTEAEMEARQWCDTGILSPVEGIWEYPEDGAKVVISADEKDHGSYVIRILTTPDCRLNPGDTIGRLKQTVDPRQFRLTQWTRKERFSLAGPLDCVATLSSDGEAIQVKSPKMKFKVNIHTLLPRFCRLIRISTDNPADKLPAGLIKVYPGYDHNGSLRRKIRIL